MGDCIGDGCIALIEPNDACRLDGAGGEAMPNADELNDEAGTGLACSLPEAGRGETVAELGLEGDGVLPRLSPGKVDDWG